jgi:plasmid maintenance system killer protein
MKKLTKEQNKEIAFRSLLCAIPYAGAFLTEIVYDSRSRIKQERVNSFISEFAEYMNAHSEKPFELEDINAEQIGDVLEEIVISVSRTSAEHKRLAFKKILEKQLLTSELETDETLRFVNITNELTKNQFKILNAFNSLSDNVLKYKVQILELQKEKKDLYREIRSKHIESTKQIEKLRKREAKIPSLIKRKRNALQNGKINPNYHVTFDLNRETYISEIQDLISKGLLFDFVLKSQIIDPFVHFGITNLGRGYMNYISAK